ncbi:hypothetical protein JM18_008136 [Phytophthora kernoviae]|uniref:5'-nucleotidase n=2 Tax=Phytophthora kernoviae TaxID=325452 RepID=A0A8T0LPB8_9STRA|nr:hypothetical protein G195_007937 [Phytophthora kernoviae 00238/432]KAG2515766.1 hypothetical protein JM18_008136 [Phytophthora kernoviae]KAG2517211.1 hypothetical protein JM16_007490 [Phytophthora kernoviae]
MIEWWTKTHELMIKHGVTRKAIEKAVEASDIEFRQGFMEIFSLLARENVPTLIFSAGLYDVIHAILNKEYAKNPAKTPPNNVHVISNMMRYERHFGFLSLPGPDASGCKEIQIIMKVAQVLAFASTLAVAANGYSFADNIEKEEPVKESTGLTVNEESRIYGGKEVDIDRYPFAVSIRMDFFDEAFCGGALIAPGWVLTAGHCIKTDEFDLLAVLGSQEREGNAGEEIKVVKGFRHPQYHKKKHLYDIGLLKLAKPSTHETAKLCAEDGSDNEVGTVATIVGWGLTENRTESNTLLGVNVEIITNAECNKRYDNRITEGMLCAGKGDGKDSCNGDSGGPLIANNILVGIASWGRKCGARPGVYTRLTYVMDYINDIMGGGDGIHAHLPTQTFTQASAIL